MIHLSASNIVLYIQIVVQNLVYRLSILNILLSWIYCLYGYYNLNLLFAHQRIAVHLRVAEHPCIAEHQRIAVHLRVAEHPCIA